MGSLGTWLVGLAVPAIRKILLSLGIGLASYAAIATALTSALSAAKNAFAGFGGDALAIVQISGMSQALSIIAGAMVGRVSMMAIKKFEVLA